MPISEPAYFTAFKNFAFTRTPSGVLTLRFHTEGGAATFTGQMHTDFPRALYEIGGDRDNRVLVADRHRRPVHDRDRRAEPGRPH